MIPSQFRKIIIFTFIISLIATCFASPALSQSQILPNGVEFLGDTNTLAPGSAYNVSVQVTIDGAALKSKGIRVYFLSGDDSYLPASLGTYVLTDASGKATYGFVTGNFTGNVTLTASAMTASTGISATKTFTLVGYGNIIGYTVDQTGANIGSASVTLYNSNGTSKGSLAQVANNPMVSASDGAYSFNKVPVGDYYIEAVKDNGTGYSVNTIGLGSQSINIRIIGYVPSVAPTVTPSAEPTSTETPTLTVLPTAVPSATPGPANDQQATGIIAAGIALAIIILIGVLVYGLFVKK
jgi:hypothetical protein